MDVSSAEKMQIRRRIVKEFAAGDYLRSTVALTLDLLLRDFPPDLEDAVRIEVEKMADEKLLIKTASPPHVYRLNPNKYIEIQHIRHSYLEVMQPHEDSIPEGFPKTPTFIRESSKESKGVLGKYFYYMRESDGYWIYYIVTGLPGRPEKGDMGSLNEGDSDIFAVWFAIDKKLKLKTFYKAQLDTLIGNHRIVQNRQPIKAAIDILEFLQYIRKTGKKTGISEEYEKTDRRPPDPGLDKYYNGGS